MHPRASERMGNEGEPWKSREMPEGHPEKRLRPLSAGGSIGEMARSLRVKWILE